MLVVVGVIDFVVVVLVVDIVIVWLVFFVCGGIGVGKIMVVGSDVGCCVV